MKLHFHGQNEQIMTWWLTYHGIRLNTNNALRVINTSAFVLQPLTSNVRTVTDN